MVGSVPDIPGTKADNELAQTFRYEVANLLDRKQTSFPGAQPVSFAARHLQELQQQDYYVCEKSDGIRCLMYLTSDGPNEIIYLIDRKNDYYHVEGLHFPPGDDERSFHKDTIVDGELVNDTQPNGTIEMKYLVFDCLVLDGNSLMHRTLDKRLAYFRERVFYPYKALYEKYPEEIQFLPFLVKFKKMEFSYAIEMMFYSILPNLPHGNDGLIFTCRNSPYQFGTDQHILKWKTEDENSIDFRMALQFPMVDPDTEDEDGGSPYPDYSAMPQFNLSVFGGSGNQDIPYGTMAIERHEWERMKAMNEPLNDRIVECYMDKMQRWRFLRFRDDKKEANHVSTVESVMESIRDKVSKDDLIKASRRIREEWKKRAAIEETNAKAANEGRKPAPTQRPTNGQPNETHDVSSGVKRKFGSGDETPKPENNG